MDEAAFGRQLGARLRAERERLHLSLADVEKLFPGGLSAQLLGFYERGQRGVRMERLDELARFYGVPVTALIPAAGVRLPE